MDQQNELWDEFYKLKETVGLDFAKAQFKIERRQTAVRYKALRSNFIPLNLDLPRSIDDRIMKALKETDPEKRSCSFLIGEMTYVSFAQALPQGGVSTDQCVIMDEKEQVYLRIGN